jgi:hypothetical protein
VGVSKPVTYQGSSDDLDSLLYIIRQNKMAVSTSKHQGNTESSFVTTLNQLADLRDRGVLTQEEFEEKKRKILQDSE